MVSKIAIIKTGEFETFHEGDEGLDVSLGDVLRTTPLLALFRGFEIHWFTSARAMPLVKRVPGLASVRTDVAGLEPHAFDCVINLERSHAAVLAMEAVPESRRIGFVAGHEAPLIRCAAGHLWTIEAWKNKELEAGHPLWQHWLFALLGRTWQGERYRFDAPQSRERFDYGLNWKVGAKWPGKTLPVSRWEELAETFGRSGSVTWQEGFDDLEEYLRWISLCRTIVTHDSLGMHLGLAMGKRLLVFFNQPNESEVTLYGQGRKIFFGEASGPFAQAEMRA